MSHRILITETIEGEWIGKLKSKFSVRIEPKLWQSPNKLKTLLPAYDALIVRNQTQVTADVIATGSQLQIIGRAGAGLDNINVDEATTVGIVVANTPDQNSISVAEFTVGILLVLARKVISADKHVKDENWQRQHFMGYELFSKTLGVVGLGRIGCLTALKARALGMRIIAHDKFITSNDSVVTKSHAKLVELKELLRQSDFVSCHLPLTSETKYMFDYDQFSCMKPSSFFLNIARGGIVNEHGLNRALKEEKIAGAALDVREQEPPEKSPLSKTSNVILTPHIAAFTHEAQERVTAAVCRDVAFILEGKAAKNYVNFPRPKIPLIER
jgi:D-3-phosphoglycerate dehydrogenase